MSNDTRSIHREVQFLCLSASKIFEMAALLVRPQHTLGTEREELGGTYQCTICHTTQRLIPLPTTPRTSHTRFDPPDCTTHEAPACRLDGILYISYASGVYNARGTDVQIVFLSTHENFPTDEEAYTTERRQTVAEFSNDGAKLCSLRRCSVCILRRLRCTLSALSTPTLSPASLGPK